MFMLDPFSFFCYPACPAEFYLMTPDCLYCWNSEPRGATLVRFSPQMCRITKLRRSNIQLQTIRAAQRAPGRRHRAGLYQTGICLMRQTASLGHRLSFAKVLIFRRLAPVPTIDYLCHAMIEVHSLWFLLVFVQCYW